MTDESTLGVYVLTCTTLHITIHHVIESFKSKDLRRYWESGQPRGINPNFASKVQLLLDALDTVDDVEQLNMSGFGLHPLTGNRQGQWSMIVSRNWRITFRFEDGNALDVDFEDYHGK